MWESPQRELDMEGRGLNPSLILRGNPTYASWPPLSDNRSLSVFFQEISELPSHDKYRRRIIDPQNEKDQGI
jgi:hypothetical protein